MEAIGSAGNVLWSDVIVDTIESGEASGELQEELKYARLGSAAPVPASLPGLAVSTESEESAGAMASVEAPSEKQAWESKFKDPMLLAEALKGLVAATEDSEEALTARQTEVMETFTASGKFTGENPTIHFARNRLPDTASASAKGVQSHLFVAPRYFRGIGMDEELSAFLEYSRAVEKLVFKTPFLKSLGVDESNFTMIALHPLMVNERGTEDYGRRAPHPALLFQYEPKGVAAETVGEE